MFPECLNYILNIYSFSHSTLISIMRILQLLLLEIVLLHFKLHSGIFVASSFSTYVQYRFIYVSFFLLSFLLSVSLSAPYFSLISIFHVLSLSTLSSSTSTHLGSYGMSGIYSMASLRIKCFSLSVL